MKSSIVKVVITMRLSIILIRGRNAVSQISAQISHARKDSPDFQKDYLIKPPHTSVSLEHSSNKKVLGPLLLSPPSLSPGATAPVPLEDIFR